MCGLDGLRAALHGRIHHSLRVVRGKPHTRVPSVNKMSTPRGKLAAFASHCCQKPSPNPAITMAVLGAMPGPPTGTGAPCDNDATPISNVVDRCGSSTSPAL